MTQTIAHTFSDFSKSSRGKTVNRLLIISLAVSTVSFALNMIRLGTYSLFMIPSAWGLTVLNHITLLCRLAKYKKRAGAPTCDTPPFLKHAFNIWISVITSIVWLAGGIMTVTFVAAFNYYYSISGLDAVDLVAGVIGTIEGGLVMTLVVLFWRALSREGYSGIACNCVNMHITRDAESTIADNESCARGPKKHLKRLAAPSSWMLDKLSGTYAPRPSPGPHKLRESLPLSIFLRNRLKYALTGREVTAITAQRLIKVDGKVRTDNTYPTGFMDVVSIDKSGEHFRLLYDVKGRFVIHRITGEEATYKLLKVRKVALGARGVPYVVTHDGRTVRYPDPNIKVNDTVKFDLTTGKITDFVKFDTGNLVIITGGRNMGRAGTITHRERHIGGFDIVHVKDVLDRTFATRISNIFVIGEGSKAWISLPKGKGTKLTISEERDQRRRQRVAEA
ncbi:40S ribosomal protein S4 [Ceratobasidium sp. 395]|nr:40S ribosomal protein S4 [Ceratobasidium sp. 395]